MFLNLSSVGGMVVGLAFVRSWKEQCLLCSNDDYEVVGSRGMLALRWIMLKDDTERDNTKRRGRIIEEQRHGKMKMQSMYITIQGGWRGRMWTQDSTGTSSVRPSFHPAQLKRFMALFFSHSPSQ